MPQPLSDAVVVITGASSGIGRSAAVCSPRGGQRWSLGTLRLSPTGPRAGSVPFWMKFNMEPSLEALKRYLDSAEPFDEIWMTLFQHGVECVGLPPL